MLKNWEVVGPCDENMRGPLGHYEISAGEVGNRQRVVQCVYTERYARLIAQAVNRLFEEGEGDIKLVCPVR